MFIDSLPIWGFIGKVEKLGEGGGGKQGGGEKLSLFTHIHFDVLHSKDQVIQVDISTGVRGRGRGEGPAGRLTGTAWASGAQSRHWHCLPL